MKTFMAAAGRMRRLVYLSGGAARRDDSLRAASGGSGDDDFAARTRADAHAASNVAKKIASSSIELAAGKTLAETELGRSRRSDISQGAEGLPGER